MATYDENDIKILTEEEITQRIMFKRIEELAAEYGTSTEWLTRLFESAYTVCVPEQYVIDKYLKKMDLPINEELQEAHRELMRNTFTIR